MTTSRPGAGEHASDAATVHVLRAGRARATVVPAHGCLIHEFDPGGGDVLWSDGRRPRVLVPSELTGEESAQEFDEEVLVGGWFPMFPGAGLPTPSTAQHGWAPRVPWTMVAHADDRVVCVADGPFLDGGVAELTRTIALEDGALTVSTVVRNTGSGVRSFTWGEHPCFSRAFFAPGRVLFAGEPVVAVPAHADGGAGHIARHGAHATGALLGPAGSVTLRDVAGTLPHWLLWSNHAAADLPRADTIAWEPSTAAGLGVGDALAAGTVQRLEAGDVFHAVVRCEWTLSTISHASVR